MTHSFRLLCLTFIIFSTLSLLVAEKITLSIAILTFFLLLPGLVLKKLPQNKILAIQIACLLFSLATLVNSTNISDFIGAKQIIISGRICSYPNDKNFSTYAVCLNDTRFKAMVTTDLMPHYNYGDRLTLSCKPRKPLDYLVAENYIFTCFANQKQIKLDQKTGLIRQVINNTRKNTSVTLGRRLTEPAAQIAKAMILGEKTSLNISTKNYFSWSGLSHLLAISGMHLSIIASFISIAMLSLGINRNQIVFFLLPFILFFVSLTGYQQSTIRASFFISYVWLGILLGRLINSTYLLIIAAFFILLFNPSAIHLIGFQLSFAAIVGLFTLNRKVNDFIKKMIKLKYVSGIIAASISIEIMIWPIIAYHFNQLPLLSTVANIPAIPLASLGIIILLTAISLNAISFTLATPLFFIADRLFYILFLIAKTFSIIPNIQISGIKPWHIPLYYLAVLLVVRLKTKKQSHF